jgi:xanthine dehydrogenase accessory factor
MRELRQLVEAARRLRDAGEPFLISMVVAVQGSAYRGSGARMLSSAERWVAGSVSGGCLERDVLRKGFWHTREARAVLLSYDETSQERGGTGCQGQVELLVERAPAAAQGSFERHARCDPLALAERCLRDETSAAVATVFRSKRDSVAPGDRLAFIQNERLSSFADPLLERELSQALDSAREHSRGAELTRGFVSAEGDVAALLEIITAPPHLFVFGAGHDSAALVTLAEALGLSVTVCSEQPLDSVARERFRGQARLLVGSAREAVTMLDRCAQPLAVVMAHHYERDRSAIEALSHSRAGYVGVLGPALRTERMLSDLAESGALDAAGIAALKQTRLHAPAGLDLGSRTPPEVALSILAELQGVLRGMSAQSLRQKTRSIHD